MLRTSLITASMLFAAVVSAQTEPAARPATAPALVATVTPETNDSPLVLAAKRSVAARHRVTVKIDNTTVKHATKLMTTTDTPRTLPRPLPPAPVERRKAKVSVLPAQSAKKLEPRPPTRADAEEMFTEEERPPVPPPSPKP
jgi:hypothetical protein